MSRITIPCINCGIGYDIHHGLKPPARFIKVVSKCPNCDMNNITIMEAEIMCPDCKAVLEHYPEYMYCEQCKQIWKECAYRHCKELFKPTINPHTRHRYHTVPCRILENTELEKTRKPKRVNKIKKMCHCCKRAPVAKNNYWLCETCYRNGGDNDEYRLSL